MAGLCSTIQGWTKTWIFRTFRDMWGHVDGRAMQKHPGVHKKRRSSGSFETCWGLWVAGLCSTILRCMKPRIPSVAGTSFITTGTAVGTNGRLCHNRQTICDFQGCGCATPVYMTTFLTRLI